MQCVGSRDLQSDADFCSNACCMIAIKEALVAKEKFGEQVDTTIFYMDMRTFGKSYQRYRDAAEKDRLTRGRECPKGALVKRLLTPPLQHWVCKGQHLCVSHCPHCAALSPPPHCALPGHSWSICWAWLKQNSVGPWPRV